MLIVLIRRRSIRRHAFVSRTLHHSCDKTSVGTTSKRENRISPCDWLSTNFQNFYYQITQRKLIALSNFSDIEKIKTGIAEQVSHFLNLLFSFVICVVMSFVYGWELTLIVISYIPVLCIMNIVIAKASRRNDKLSNCVILIFSSRFAL